jgi:signal transduction histidine kinase
MRFSFNKISYKLLVVCLSFTLPIAVMLKLMIEAKDKDIEFGTMETYGDKYQRRLETVLCEISRHRLALLRGDAAGATAAAAKVDAGIASVVEVNQELGETLQFTPEGLGKRKRTEFTAENLAKNWAAEKARNDPEAAGHAALIAHVKTMITHVGDISNLILDPDLDSYYLMDDTLLAFPQAEDRIQEIGAFVERVHKHGGQLTADEKIQASVFAALYKESDLDRIQASGQTSLNEDQNFYGVSKTLQERLPAELTSVTTKGGVVVEALKKVGASGELATIGIEPFRSLVNESLASLYTAHAVAFDEEDQLLANRLVSIQADKSRAAAWTAFALAIASLLAFAITRNLLKRVAQINGTTQRITGGDLTARVNMKSADELGQLAGSFDTMTDRVANLTHGLEHKIAERTATIRTILDNVRSGFLLVDKELVIQDGFTASCRELVGESVAAGAFLPKVLGLAEREGEHFRLCIDQVFEDLMPVEVTLDQIPRRFEVMGRIVKLEGRVVRDAAGAVHQILFTVNDVTALEKAERDAQVSQCVIKILRQKDAFIAFLADFRQSMIAGERANGEQARLRALLHTLKGNSLAFGLSEVAEHIHHVEDNAYVTPEDFRNVNEKLVKFLDQNAQALNLVFEGSEPVETFHVDRRKVDKLAKVIGVMRSRDELATAIHDWVYDVQLKRAGDLVGPLPDLVEGLAARFGKDVRFQISGNDVRVNPKSVMPVMQNVTHLLRNCLDHGIEMPYEREGKPEHATVEIAFSETDDFWTITVRDDGRGIDGDKVAAKAVGMGLLKESDVKAMSAQAKVELIFMNGLSTADAISDVSGRGVGMTAVYDCVRRAGGELRVKTAVGQGTTFELAVPKPQATERIASEMVHEVTERRKAG